ncbi:protein kinase byr1 [Copidosoma floridanum]|uniref:protein kinase byr1 n=1 Tax=Copidosoma floridanum TaxID=29053 RepID=UPI0006C94E6D|nr:protein kinase byr1 [Copidosoma floridanum]
MAVSFIHDLTPSVIHKDIKPENILVNEACEVKLIDFGLSRFEGLHSELNSTVGSHPKGTTLYLSPEIIVDKQSHSVKSDIWALGCVIVEIFSEKSIWTVSNNDMMCGLFNTLRAILIQNKKPDMSYVPNDLKKILKCFYYRPDNRPKASTILDVLKCSDSDFSDEN